MAERLTTKPESSNLTLPHDSYKKDLLKPVNVLELKAKIKDSLERSLESSKLPQNLRLGRDISAEKKALKDRLIEEYLQTGNSGNKRVVPSEVREQLEKMLSFPNKESESRLSQSAGSSPESSTSSALLEPSRETQAAELSATTQVMATETGNNSSQTTTGSEGVTAVQPTEPTSPTIEPAFRDKEDDNGQKSSVSVRKKGKEFLKNAKEKLRLKIRRALAATAITATAFSLAAPAVASKGMPERGKQSGEKTELIKKKSSEENEINLRYKQAVGEDHTHNKTVEGGFEKGATPEQAGEQMEKFMTHRGEVLSVFMYAAKNGISVDKARAHIGDISDQTKKIISKDGKTLTAYGEKQAKAAQHLIDNAKLSWVSTAELQNLYNSGVYENQNPSGRDDELAINQSPGFDASVRVLKIELENGNVIYLKGNCANFLWKGALTSFTHKGRTVTVTVPPSRSVIPPSTPRQPKQPQQPTTPTTPTPPPPPPSATPETPPEGLMPKNPAEDINANPNLNEQVQMGPDRVTAEPTPTPPAATPPAEYTPPPPPPVSTEPAPGAEPVSPEAPPPPAPEEGTGTTTTPNNGTVGTPP